MSMSEYATLSRGTAPNRNHNWSLQPNISLTRGAHNIRSGLDFRWTNVHNENYNNSGGLRRSSTATSPQQLNSTSELEGNAFASFLLGAPSGGVSTSTRCPLPLVLRGAVDPGRLAGHQPADA